MHNIVNINSIFNTRCKSYNMYIQDPEQKNLVIMTRRSHDKNINYQLSTFYP